LEGNTITEIRRVTPPDLARNGRRVTAPQVIEAEGMYVKLWLAHGITTVRVFAGDQDDPAVQIADDQRAGKPGLLPDVLKALADQARQLDMDVAVHLGQDGVVPMSAVAVAGAGVTTED